MTEPPERARGAVGHKPAFAVGPPCPVLSNRETAVSLQAATYTLGGRSTKAFATGRRAWHRAI